MITRQVVHLFDIAAGKCDGVSKDYNNFTAEERMTAEHCSHRIRKLKDSIR